MQRCAIRWQDKLLVWVKHPGWVPAGVTPPPCRPTARREIPALTLHYAATQVSITIAFALAVLWFRDRFELWLQIAAAAVVLWSTWSIGGLLDGRKRAQQHELLRLLGALALAIALAAAGRHFWLSLVMGALWSLSLLLAWPTNSPQHFC